MLSSLLRRTPLPASSAAADMDEPSVPLQVFEVSVNRWDDVGGHATFRAEVSARELPPELSRRSLSFAADAEAHAGLARILLPAFRPDKAQRITPTRSPAASLKEPWRAERVAQFDEFRLLRRELYAILSGKRCEPMGSAPARSTAGSSSGSDAGTATSEAASAWDEAPRTGEHGLPPFPPTLLRRSLGLSLSSSQMRARAAGLDAWLRAVVLALPSLPPPAVGLVATWMGLDGARAAELAAAEAASSAGECDPIAAPSPSPPSAPATERLAPRAWGFRPGNRALPAPAPALASPGTPGAISPALLEKESPEHTEARVKITRMADSLLSEGAIDRREHALMLLPFAAPPPDPRPAPAPAPAPIHPALPFTPPPPGPGVTPTRAAAARRPSSDADDDDSDAQDPDPGLALDPALLRLQALVDREGRGEGHGADAGGGLARAAAVAGGGGGCCSVS